MPFSIKKVIILLQQSTFRRFAAKYYCRLKACIAGFSLYFFTFLDSFRNKSDKPQPIRTKIGTRTQIKGRQRSQNFGRDRLSGGEMGAQKCPRSRFFLSAIRDHFSATSQRLIFAKFGHDTWIGDEMQILDRNLWKVSIQGSFVPKTPNLEGSHRHLTVLTQSRLQVKGCIAERYCLLLIVIIIQGPRSFRDQSTYLYDVRLRSYGASNLPNFRILAYFPNTKPLKRTFWWPA